MTNFYIFCKVDLNLKIKMSYRLRNREVVVTDRKKVKKSCKSVDAFEISSMTERDLDRSIIAKDQIYQLIIEEDMEATILYGHVEELNADSSEEDSIDSSEENNADSYANKDYYDERDFEEADLESMMTNIDINSENIQPLIFTTTIRGGRKLLCDGYSYVRDRGDFELTQWKCNFSVRVAGSEGKFKSLYCPGRCHSMNDKKIKIITEHQS